MGDVINAQQKFSQCGGSSLTKAQPTATVQSILPALVQNEKQRRQLLQKIGVNEQGYIDVPNWWEHLGNQLKHFLDKESFEPQYFALCIAETGLDDAILMIDGSCNQEDWFCDVLMYQNTPVCRAKDILPARYYLQITLRARP